MPENMLHRASRRHTVAILLGLLCLPWAARGDLPEGPLADALWQRAAARTTAAAAGLDGVLGVAVRDLTTGRRFSLRGGEVFPVASIIKVGVLVALHRERERGRLQLDERVTLTRARMVGDEGLLSQLGDGTSAMSLGDLAAAMIVLSENSATNILIDRLGMDSINGAFRAAGLRRTVLSRRMLDLPAARAGRENLSTPEELLLLFEQLYRGRLLSPQGTEAALRPLRAPEKGGALLPRAVARGVAVLHKPGELDGVRGDCGIVEEPRRPFALCLLTTALGRDEEGAEVIVQVARAWYELFHRLGSSSPHGRLLPPQ